MTRHDRERTPRAPKPDDLGLTSEEWLDLQYAYNYGTIEPAPGTVEAEAFRQMDDYARREAERVAAAEAADEAWRASRPGCAPQAGPEPEAGQGGPGRGEAGKYTRWQTQPASPGQREAARDHVTRLRQDGGTYRSIAAAAALSPATVHGLASGRRRAQPGTAAAVLTVTSPALPRARLDATGTRLRLRALHVMGHGSARIARAVGVHPVTIRKLVRGDARTVSQQLRDTIADLYDAWWDKRAPGRTRFERAAATAARKRAIAGDWCAAAALDDDLLDIPGYRPRYGWKPATGTGVAPDIRPPAATTAGGKAHDSDHRIGLDLFNDVLDVLDRHGFARGDDQHAGRAIVLIGDLARIYEGSQDHPLRPSTTRRHTCRRHPSRPARSPNRTSVPEDDLDAVTLTHAEVSTVFAALDIAAD